MGLGGRTSVSKQLDMMLIFDKRTFMLKLARLDTPGVLHHVIIRGIECRKIIRDNKDKIIFLTGWRSCYLNQERPDAGCQEGGYVQTRVGEVRMH